MKTPRSVTPYLLLLLSASMIACGGKAPATSSPNPISPVSVSLSGAPASIYVGASAQLTATVSGATDGSVTWLVNGVAGGSSTTGTITAAGLYTAPITTTASTNSISLTATSKADPTKSASAGTSVLYPVPFVSALTPATIPVGSASTTITLTGSGFTPSTAATLAGASLATTFLSSTQISAVIPATSLASPATLAVGTSNPAPGGGASATTLAFNVAGGTLNVSVTDLPAATSGSVLVTDSTGNKRTVTATSALILPVGTYTVTAASVQAGSSTFYPTLPSQVVTVSNGATASAVVDYYTQIPLTTKVLDSTGKAGLTANANFTSITLPSTSTIAANLAPGDVLVSSTIPAAPGGLAVKIVSVGKANGGVTATTVPAALQDIFQRASIDTDITSSAATKFGLTPPAGPAPYDVVTDPCGGTGAINVMHDFNDLIGLDVASQVEVCPSIHFHVDIGLSGVNSASFIGNFAQYGQVTVTGGSFSLLDKELDMTPIVSPPIVVDISGVPVEFTLSATVFVHPTLTVVGGFQTGAAESYTGQAGVTYANGKWSTVKSQQGSRSAIPVTINASADAKLAAGVKFAVNLYHNFGTVYFSPDEYLELKADVAANPWWTLHYGVEGTMGIQVNLFGYTVPDLPVFQLFDIDNIADHANGPFQQQIPTVTAFTPTQASAGATGANMIVTGTNFVPGDVVTLGGTALTTTWVSATQLNATVPPSALAIPGSYAVAVVDSASKSTVLAPSKFTVIGGVLSSITVTPSTIYGGSSAVGTVTLGIPAPAAGAVVTLSSSSAVNANVPASVTVPSGQTSATFAITTGKVSTATKVSLTAAYGTDQVSTSVTVSSAIATLFPGSSMLGVNPQRTNTTTAAGPKTQPVFLPIISGLTGGLLRRVGADGTIIVTYAQSCGTTNSCGTVAAYTSAGTLKWSRVISLLDGNGFSDVAIAPAGTVYVTTYYGQQVIALNASTGAILWQTVVNTTGGNESGDILLDPSGNLYVQASSSVVGPTLQLTSLAPDGTIRWNVPISRRAYEYTALSNDALSLYFDGDLGYPYAPLRAQTFSAATGAITATVTCQISSILAVAPTGVYGLLTNNHLAAITPSLSSCSDLETSQTTAYAGLLLALTNAGTVITSINNTAVALNSSGAVLWTYPQPLAGGLADSNGTLFEAIGTLGSNVVLALDTSTGTQLWQVAMPDTVYNGYPVNSPYAGNNILLGPDGSLYVQAGTKIYKATP